MTMKAIDFAVGAECLVPEPLRVFNRLQQQNTDKIAAEKLAHLIAGELRGIITHNMVSEPHTGLMPQGKNTSYRIDLVVMTPKQLATYVNEQLDERRIEAFAQIRALLNEAP